jgi:hypothetical protein
MPGSASTTGQSHFDDRITTEYSAAYNLMRISIAEGLHGPSVVLRAAASQEPFASGIFIREDRKDAEAAKQDASRSLRLCGLLR